MNAYEATQSGEEMIGVIALVAVLVFWLVLLAVGIVQYVLQAIALNDLGKRRNIKNPWLAWIPVTGFSTWVMGCIADEYDARNGIKRKWRVILLSTLLSFIGLFAIGYIVMIIGAIAGAIQNGFYGEDAVISAIIVPVIVGYIFIIASMVVSSAYVICEYICLFKIFESTVPEKALKYLLLSILVPLAYPICLMRCRNKGYSVFDEIQKPVYEQAQPAQPAPERIEAADNNPENTQDGE